MEDVFGPPVEDAASLADVRFPAPEMSFCVSAGRTLNTVLEEVLAGWISCLCFFGGTYSAKNTHNKCVRVSFHVLRHAKRNECML